MFKNHIRIALRQLRKQKAYALINISGLALGMSCTFLILLWARDERGYDQFHENAGSIYRVVVEWKENSRRGARTPAPLAEAMLQELPEVAKSVRLHKRPRMVLRHGERGFYEEGELRADPTLFDIFTFPFVAGNREALESGMVITQKMARKYFGEADPLGKVLNVNNWFEVPVSGVLAELPRNSSLQFDFVLALNPLKKFWPGGFGWGNFAHETFIQLRPGADPAVVARHTTELLRKNVPAISTELNRLYLQPLREVYLSPEVRDSQFAMGDKKYVYVFSGVAFLVLMIACINFMNLATARALSRTKEISVRKVMGSSRAQLVRQFLTESVLLSILATLLAIICVEILLPAFNRVSGKSLALSFSDLRLLLGLATITVLAGIVAGSYPALYLSSFHARHVLKSAPLAMPFARGSGKAGLRKALVVLQFALAIVLLASTAVIHEQLHYMTRQQLGFDKDNLVYIPLKGNLGAHYRTAKDELRKHPEILAVAAQGSVPTITVNTGSLLWEGKDSRADFPVEANAVDYNFFELMNMEMVAGRSFSEAFATDASAAFIVNEETVKMMGMASPIGRQIRLGNRKGAIIGVVKNAHFKSMRRKIEPQVFYVPADYSTELMDLFGIVLVKIRGGERAGAIARLEHVWQQVNPDFPFEYHFLDQTYEALYQREEHASTLFNYFALLAVLLSCLGLLGLAAFTTESRTKEVGIRKVLGASVSRLVLLFTSDFAKWVLLANVFAWPVAWLATQHWLQDFAYHVEVGWRVFAWAGGLALVVAQLTVGVQALKAALANPVEALRYE